MAVSNSPKAFRVEVSSNGTDWTEAVSGAGKDGLNVVAFAKVTPARFVRLTLTDSNANAGAYRFEPRTFKFETYVNYRFANPHGHVFNRWGQDIVIDGTGAAGWADAGFTITRAPYPS